MTILSKFKIRIKLSVLITLMIMGIFSVGAVGYYYNSMSKQNLSTMYYENLNPIESLEDARTHARANKANLLELMLTTDVTSRKNILVDIETRRKAIDGDLSDYEKSTLDSYEVSITTC